MPRLRPKRLGSLSAGDVSPRKLRRSKELEDLTGVGKSPVSAKAEGEGFFVKDLENALLSAAGAGKENSSGLADPKFQDETVTVALSGIENYFLQGKTAQMNKSRATRRRPKSIPHQADNNLSEELEDEDDEEDDDENKFSHCDLGLLRDYLKEEENKSRNSDAFKKITEDFQWWTFCLAGGFNLLIYGVGSKREILDEFRRRELSQFCTISIDGFREDVTVKSILTYVVNSMNLKDCEQKRRSVIEWAKHIGHVIERTKRQVIILLNNIDGPNLRDPSDQTALAALVENPAVLMVATVDHINASLLHTTHNLQSFNWVYCRADTFAFSRQELLAGQSALLGLNPKSNQSTHSLSSLDVLWQSLATNSRSILRLFYAMYFENNEAISFWDLFSAAKDEFLVSSDTALRQQLVEFSDHHVLRWKRAEDGNEQLVGCLDRSLLEKFLAEKGLNLDPL